MKTNTISKKTVVSFLIIALFFCQNMLAQQSQPVEDTSLTHSTIFILSVLFFTLGFVLFLTLKLREDAKEKREEKTTLNIGKHRHFHPNHYGHGHRNQYNH